jgi:hypothetical protein
VYAPKTLADYGNNRVIQKEDLHKVHYVSNPNDPRRRVAAVTEEVKPDGDTEPVVDDVVDLVECLLKDPITGECKDEPKKEEEKADEGADAG